MTRWSTGTPAAKCCRSGTRLGESQADSGSARPAGGVSSPLATVPQQVAESRNLAIAAAIAALVGALSTLGLLAVRDVARAVSRGDDVE